MQDKFKVLLITGVLAILFVASLFILQWIES